MNKGLITARVEQDIVDGFNALSKDLEVNKTWLIKNALRSYLERYDELLSDYRIASRIGDGIPLEEVMREYGMEAKDRPESI